MTKTWKRRAFRMAAGLAVMMHLLLFVAVRPADGNHSGNVRIPPETYYRTAPSGTPPESGDDIRTLWSPILFSLPSPRGFSRDLMKDKLSTRLTFSQPEEEETFLGVDPTARTTGAQIIPRELMITAGNSVAPCPPIKGFQPATKKAPARRVHVDPALKERLEGGIVLPPELNQQGDAAWEVLADINISREGIVRHVFLEQPLESASLNQSVIRLLHGLQFSRGSTPLEGRIEIYSATAPNEKESP